MSLTCPELQTLKLMYVCPTLEIIFVKLSDLPSQKFKSLLGTLITGLCPSLHTVVFQCSFNGKNAFPKSQHSTLGLSQLHDFMVDWFHMQLKHMVSSLGLKHMSLCSVQFSIKSKISTSLYRLQKDCCCLVEFHCFQSSSECHILLESSPQWVFF